jgi:hypothetical protein
MKPLENPSKKHGILDSGHTGVTASVETDNYPKDKRFSVNEKTCISFVVAIARGQLSSSSAVVLTHRLEESVVCCLRIPERFSELAGCLRPVVESLETRIGFLDGTLLVSFSSM